MRVHEFYAPSKRAGTGHSLFVENTYSKHSFNSATPFSTNSTLVRFVKEFTIIRFTEIRLVRFCYVSFTLVRLF